MNAKRQIFQIEFQKKLLEAQEKEVDLALGIAD
jgi:hypothetical protein